KPDLPWAGTFHSFCVRLMRSYSNACGVPPDFSIYDEEDSVRVISELMHERQLSNEGVTARQVKSLISRIKNGGKFDHRNPIARLAEQLLEYYQERLRSAAAFDFDDLLLVPLECMKQNEA